MTQLNEKQVKMFAKTIMPFLYQLQEMQDLYESKFRDKDQAETQELPEQESEIKDQAETQELPEQESEITNENEVKPPC